MIRHQGKEIECALRKTAQLRTLALSLRWASERAMRERLLAEFESWLHCSTASAHGIQHEALPSPEVLLVGVKACWARGDYATIRRIAGLLPPDVLERHELLRAYAIAASEQQSSDSSANVSIGSERMKVIIKGLRKQYGLMLKRLAD